jgi:hypothetical protein
MVRSRHELGECETDVARQGSLVGTHTKYADGSARSKVANAVQRGVAAHGFDDDKDGYQVKS